MPTATTIVKRVGRLLSKLNPNVDTIYKRTTIRDGGDLLLAVPNRTTVVDTALNPPPSLSTPSQLDPFVLSTAGIVSNTDYILLCSAETITSEELDLPETSFVRKTYAGVVKDEFAVISYDVIALFGLPIVYKVLIRSRKR